MRILVSGASGLIGTTVVSAWRSLGHEVGTLRRPPKSAGRFDLLWNPPHDWPAAAALEGWDAVVHLAGDNVASGRWTAQKKQRIRDSRVQITQDLAQRLAALQKPPSVLLCASAIGLYGSRGDDVLTESSAPGQGFLADTCQAWEAACAPAKAAGIRVVHLRFGMVLSPRGGALALMRWPFWWGLGGPLGNGQQWMSWVTIDDVFGAMRHALAHSSIQGPMNVVAPAPLKQHDFGAVLAQVLRRPYFFKVPSAVLRLALGEMADGMLLASARVMPSVLEQSGYRFLFPDVESALRHLLR